MKTVTITTYESDPPRILATLAWDPVRLTVTCDPPEFLATLDAPGAIGPDGITRYSADGQPFLDALPFEYSGLVRAEITETPDQP